MTNMEFHQLRTQHEQNPCSTSLCRYCEERKIREETKGEEMKNKAEQLKEFDKRFKSDWFYGNYDSGSIRRFLSHALDEAEKRGKQDLWKKIKKKIKGNN